MIDETTMNVVRMFLIDMKSKLQESEYNLLVTSFNEHMIFNEVKVSSIDVNYFVMGILTGMRVSTIAWTNYCRSLGINVK